MTTIDTPSIIDSSFFDTLRVKSTKELEIEKKEKEDEADIMLKEFSKYKEVSMEATIAAAPILDESNKIHRNIFGGINEIEQCKKIGHSLKGFSYEDGAISNFGEMNDSDGDDAGDDSDDDGKGKKPKPLKAVLNGDGGGKNAAIVRKRQAGQTSDGINRAARRANASAT